MTRELSLLRRFPNPSLKDRHGDSQNVLSVRFDHTGRFVLAACHKVVRLWSVDSGLLVQTYGEVGYEVTGLSARRDGERFVSCAGKGAYVWDVATTETLHRYKEHDQRVSCVCFGGAHDDLVVTGSWDKCVRLFDSRSGSRVPVQVLRGARDSISDVACAPGYAEILATSVDGKVRRYDVRQGRVRVDDLRAPISSAQVTRDQECILCSCLDATLRLLDKESGEILRCYVGHGNTDFRLDCGVLYDDSAVLSGGENGTVYLWEMAGDEDLAQPSAALQSGTDAPVCALDCHRDEPYVVVGIQDGTVALLSVSA